MHLSLIVLKAHTIPVEINRTRFEKATYLTNNKNIDEHWHARIHNPVVHSILPNAMNQSKIEIDCFKSIETNQK